MWQVYFSIRTLYSWSSLWCFVEVSAPLVWCGGKWILFTAVLIKTQLSKPVAENDRGCLGLSSSRFVVWLLTLWNPGVWELGDQFCSSNLIVCWRNNWSSPGFLAHQSLLGLKGCAIPTTGAGFWPMTCPVANHFFLTLMAGNGTVTSALRRQSHSLEDEGDFGKAWRSHQDSLSVLWIRGKG